MRKNGRLECYALGLKFTSKKQCLDFIERYNINATQPRIRALLRGNTNKVARRTRAHKLCLNAAFESYYNDRAQNGLTIRALRRRGLIEKMEV